MNRNLLICATLASLCAIGAAAAAEEAATPATESASAAQDLAKKLANPVANLVSVPLQFNWTQPYGPDDATQTLINFQPVVPFHITEDWNIIGRMVMPYINQPSLGPGIPAASGVGDTTFSAFFSPAQPRGAIWGIGPALVLPGSSDPSLGSGQWSIGPTAVVLKQTGPWTYGALVNQVWSFAGENNRADVNQMYLQPFLAYATKGGWSFTLNSESTANWDAPSGEEWTVPINLLVSKISKFGPFPASYGFGGGYFVETPNDQPDWKLRAVFTLILPQK